MPPRRGRLPSARPRTKTAANVRVRAWSRPSTATRPGPPLDEVGAPPLEPRIRSAKDREQLGALAAEPREAQRREKRGAERRLTEPEPLLDDERNAERCECRVERSPPALHGVAHETDC